MTTLTRPALGDEHNSSENLEMFSGIERLWKFSGKHDIFRDIAGKIQDIYPTRYANVHAVPIELSIFLAG